MSKHGRFHGYRKVADCKVSKPFGTVVLKAEPEANKYAISGFVVEAGYARAYSGMTPSKA